VLCGIDASYTDEAVVHAACDLAGKRGRVVLVCVISASGTGANAQATIAPSRATEAIERAMKQARDRDVPSSAHLVRSANKADALLRAAADADVLVVGSHGHSRAGGIALGGVTTNAIHRAACPVLVVRQGFPVLHGPLLVATDGSAQSESACALAGALGTRFELPVALIYVDDGGDESIHRVIARQTVSLTEATGREPSVIAERGDPVDAIVHAAAATESSVVVVGSRGLAGVRALASVSERVAHRAPCSVLVARPATSPTASDRPTAT
jgi:nucleotide-binding universal stress UspA family protein